MNELGQLDGSPATTSASPTRGFEPYGLLYRAKLREQLFATILSDVLRFSEESLDHLGAPKGKEDKPSSPSWRRACVAEKLASAGVAVLHGQYRDDIKRQSEGK